MPSLAICKLAVAILLSGNFISSSKGQTTVLDCDAEIYSQVVECPPWEDGVPTYIPYPYDCRKFIECTNGNPVVQCCPPTTVWDQDLLVCNHESVTPCIIVTTGPTTRITNPATTTSPTASPTTTTPTTTTPTTTTPTTTTPTTTIPTTTTPTTTTPTTTTPTTTTPTTTSPTTTTPTTTIPTTTSPTTTTPTTTTPTTTRLTTTTSLPTTTSSPPQDGYSFTITNGLAPTMALTIYNSTVANGIKVHAATHSPGCTNLSQVWFFEFHATLNSYILYSELSRGYNLHANSINPFLNPASNPHQDYSFWRFLPVTGTTDYYTFVNHRYSNIVYTGITNPLGVDLRMGAPIYDDPKHWWRLNRC